MAMRDCVCLARICQFQQGVGARGVQQSIANRSIKSNLLMTTNVDQREIAKFSDLAVHWWDPEGDLKTLHQINPLRMRFIQDHVLLQGKQALDLGCGGGILSESLAKAGAVVTGIDLSKPALEVAELHGLESQVKVHYELISAEAMADKNPGAFDLVTCMELLEHVPDPVAIVKASAKLLRPGGYAFFSTLNRNLKSYLFAIIGAEYLLRILPKHTHDYSKFIRPSELSQWAREAGLSLRELRGIHYDLLEKSFSLNTDVSVNYLL